MSERRQQQTPSPFHRLSTSDAEETSQLTAKVLFRETRPDEAPFLKKSVPRTGTIDNSRSWRNVEIDEETIEEHKVDLHIYGDNKQTELVFKVRARSWKLSLLDWVAKFQEQCCGQWETGDGDTPMLQLNDVAFFNRDCVPAHLSVPVQSISFGNMINAATYLSHFNRNIAQGPEAERSCKLLGALRGNQRIEHAMFVDMEHDRSVLTVRFALLDGGYKMSTNGQCAQSKDAVHIPASAVAVRMRYTSVRRIIFDTQVERNGNQVTRVYFQLNYPVEIRRYRRRPTAGRLDSIIRGDGDRQCYFPENDNDPQNNNPQNKDNFTMAINDSPFMYIEFDSSLEKDKLYEIMCRLYARIGLPLEFITIECIAAPVSRYVDPPVRVIGHDYRRERDLSSLSEAEINDQKQRLMTPIEPRVDKKWVDELKRRKCFGLEYFIAALISRGAVVKDQILRSEERKDGFMRKILKNFDHDREVTLETLERLLNAIDERRETPSLLATFDSIKENLQSHPDDLTKIYEKEKQGDYRRVRKVVLTPTRMLLVVPELLMGNRVLRKFDGTGDKALRIQFRDDNGEALKLNQVGQTIINVTVHNTMRRGIYISDRHFIYLASSNSQMRDSGCYFFDEGEDGKQVEEIRNQLGIFNKSNIPKLMARIGQCFTQAKESKVELRHKHYNQTFDIIGGRDTSGEPYTFSDGCGRISVKYAEDIASDLDLGNCVPSCFQIRFRGIKGVVSVDPWLSDRTEWSEKHSVPDNREKYKRKNKLRIHFRPSQNKFHGSVEMYIEIVKYSSPTGVCLNRPFIAILDQVSAMQGYKLHCRMTDRICELLDRQLMELAEALMLENSCRESLIELPRRINIEELSLAGGFALTQEPFFRSLLRASVAYTIKKQLSKAQIKIPPNLGRTMFGVIDETGILQYGQVFVQYSKAISNKKPARNAAKKILKGPILMTKNPQIVAGDARVFEAIDVPELRHLVNVVVFPQYGPRPHPDEMAGSDLDGDEYCVIWDERLLLENNEEPIDFTKTVRMPDNVDDSEVVPKMIEFFVNYIKQDSIGTIANAFMVNADLYGITSQVCMNIARKQSQSVDFPKTGQPPAPLVKQWTQQEDGTFLPPEKAERWPDFMTKSHKPCYVSPRLLGYLFRRIRLVEDVLAIASVSEQREALGLDQDLLYEGREEYSGIARERYNAYCADVGALLDNYGIPDEGQLFSGCVSVIRNRISDRDMDDMSFYNTLHMIEQKMSEVFLRYRIDFYKEFGGYVENTEAELSYGGSDTSEANERRICKNPSEDMQKKASAYYEICYGEASKNVTGRRILSFPWVVWDVLKSLKRTSETISIDPLNEYLCRAINTYCVDNESAMQRFMTHITKQSSSVHAIKRYCRRFEGLDRLMFIVCEWAKSERLLEDCLKMEHLCILLIQFGLGYLTDQDASSPNVFLEKTDTLLNVDEQSDEDGARSSADECVNLNDRLGGLGKCFMDFVQFLSSRRFETMKLINFMHPNLGFHSILMRGQWRHLHKAALKTLYYIVLTGRFSLLNHRIVETQNYSRSEETAVDEIYLSELEPFVIELPDDVSNEEEEELIEKMRLHSGVKYLRLRRLTKPRDHVVVSAVGTMESLHRLRALVAVKPSLNSFNNTKKRSEMVSRLVYERISALV